MRIGYSEEEDFGGQFELYQANCRRSLRGRKGQAALREMEAALLALPTKRLIAGRLVQQGDVCAIGALALHKGTREAELEEMDDEYMEGVGESYGLPRLVAWKVVEANDIDTAGKTPEERYDAMLKWVRAELGKAARCEAQWRESQA